VANASKGYTQNKFADGSPKPESYVFFQGRFFAGTPDRSIERATFLDIARTLAPDLAKQNYLPAQDVGAADLFIVVNWGTTMIEPGSDPSEVEKQYEFDQLKKSVSTYNTAYAEYAAGGAYADPAEITFNMMISRADQVSAQSYAGFNARLLGYTDALNREMASSGASPDGLSAAAETHLSDLTQERYFVILLAYDYRQMQRSRSAPGAKPPSPLWSVRMNIRADGNNFTESLPAMSQVASDYFGKATGDLVTTRASVGSRANTQIGPAEVVGVRK
jgi:hypothetical protein